MGGQKKLLIIGFLVFLAGALPFLKGIAILKPYLAVIPTEGNVYYGIVTALGLIAMLLSRKKK